MLVSVIITTYARTDFLVEAIESAINQTYKDIEIIVIDDNAKKLDIREKVKNILKNYPMCKVIYNEKNLGGALSRNVGILAAKGECISFLDDDDIYAPDRIEEDVKLYNRSEKSHIGMIYSYISIINEKGEKIGQYHHDVKENALYEHMTSCLAATSQWFCPKDVLVKVGLFEDTPCKQDSIMLLKILANDYEVKCINKELVCYREHERERISGIPERNIVGISNLRKWSRKYYSKLTKEQIKHVESVFAGDLLTYHILAEDKKNAYKCLKIIAHNELFSLRYIKSLIKLIIGKNYLYLVNRRGK